MRPDALAAVPLPLRALALEMQSDRSRFAERSSAAVGERLIVPLVSSAQFVTESAVLDLGGLAIKETLNKAGPALLVDLSLIRLTTLHNFAV
jgi:hypothetical protein